MRLIPTNSNPAKVIFGELIYTNTTKNGNTATSTSLNVFNMNNSIAIPTLETSNGLNTYVKNGDNFYYGNSVETITTYSVAKYGTQSYTNKSNVIETVTVTSKVTWKGGTTTIYIDDKIVKTMSTSVGTHIDSFSLPAGSTIKITNGDNVSVPSVVVAGKVIWKEITDNVKNGIGYTMPVGYQGTMYFSLPLKMGESHIEEFSIDIIKHRGNGSIWFGFTTNPAVNNYDMVGTQRITDTGSYTMSVPESINNDYYYVCINVTDMDFIISSLECNKPYRKKFSKDNWTYLFTEYASRFNEEV